MLNLESCFPKVNFWQKNIEHTVSREEILEVQASKIASHLSSDHSQLAKVVELKEKKKRLEFNDELNETSTDRTTHQTEASKGQ